MNRTLTCFFAATISTACFLAIAAKGAHAEDSATAPALPHAVAPPAAAAVPSPAYSGVPAGVPVAPLVPAPIGTYPAYVNLPLMLPGSVGDPTYALTYAPLPGLYYGYGEYRGDGFGFPGRSSLRPVTHRRPAIVDRLRSWGLWPPHYSSQPLRYSRWMY